MKMKLCITELKIKSFITELSDEKEQTIAGGAVKQTGGCANPTRLEAGCKKSLFCPVRDVTKADKQITAG